MKLSPKRKKHVIPLVPNLILNKTVEKVTTVTDKINLHMEKTLNRTITNKSKMSHSNLYSGS